MAARKKLTQRQYLNLMTITVAFMILIFVIIGKIMEDKDQPAPPAQLFADLDRLTLGEWQANFKDGYWQQQPAVLSESELQQLMLVWKEFTPYGWTNQMNGPTALSVELVISEQTQSWHLLLTEQPLLKLDNAEQAIILTKRQLSLLFPEKLLRSQVK